jgi:hypothetical protein
LNNPNVPYNNFAINYDLNIICKLVMVVLKLLNAHNGCKTYAIREFPQFFVILRPHAYTKQERMTHNDNCPDDVGTSRDIPGCGCFILKIENFKIDRS